jgi:hypothetical protein
MKSSSTSTSVENNLAREEITRPKATELEHKPSRPKRETRKKKNDGFQILEDYLEEEEKERGPISKSTKDIDCKRRGKYTLITNQDREMLISLINLKRLSVRKVTL